MAAWAALEGLSLREAKVRALGDDLAGAWPRLRWLDVRARGAAAAAPAAATNAAAATAAAAAAAAAACRLSPKLRDTLRGAHLLGVAPAAPPPGTPTPATTASAGKGRRR
jgi:hypothetical protein